MQTYKGKVQDTLAFLKKLHGNNLKGVYGIGSFFYGNQSRPVEEARTMDLVLVVDDLHEFYSRHKFEDMDFFSKFPDVADINDECVLYHMNNSDNYRTTIIPRHRFTEWTSEGTKLGYFLRGRMQKPLEQILADDTLEDDFERIRQDAVKTLFETEYKPFTIEEAYEKLAAISYIPEGWRGWIETKIQGKHKKIVQARHGEYERLYGMLLREYVKESEHKYDEFTEVFTPNTTRKEAKQRRKELKELKPHYQWILRRLERINPYPEDFAINKFRRITQKVGDNKVMQVISDMYKGFHNSSFWDMTGLRRFVPTTKELAESAYMFSALKLYPILQKRMHNNADTLEQADFDHNTYRLLKLCKRLRHFTSGIVLKDL